ncbi:MAG TPA: HAMP domain-containing sensor histidine kinase [Gemmatimonadaceae bacterium]|nr:HAMP domain-containing sensor histidine kinase [Gemmatimonadaceae bacterium]
MLSRWWWIPSAFVSLSLLLLFLMPIVVEGRVRKLRGELAYGSEHARVLLNDLEASFASELVVRNRRLEFPETPAASTRAQFEADEAGLRVAVRDISPDAVAHFNNLSSLLREWSRSRHDPGADESAAGLAIIAAAEGLDSVLTTVSDARREEVRGLERINLISAAVLAPVALLAMLSVTWSGRRVLRFARVAEQERAEVVRTANARAALLRGVTHDVKNPLGAAAGYAQLLEEGVVGPLSAPQVDMLHRIRRLVNTSVQTVTDLLELARADGELHIDYSAIDLASIVAEAVEDHRGMAQEHGVTIQMTARTAQVVTDPSRVRQVLANLLSNAIKYTPSGGDVRVSIVGQSENNGSSAGEVGVEVRDTGRGIPRELRDHIFEEFFRVRTDVPSENGNGLGLAISRRIARLLGGDVTFADGDGRGSVFTLWLAASRGGATAHRGHGR